MPLPALVFVVFLTLKLTEVIDWSWWWVTAPLWGCFAIVIGFFLFAAVFAGTAIKSGGIVLRRFEKEFNK